MPDYLKGRQLPTKSFVELALVHQQELPRKDMDEFTRGTVQEGDIDAIMRKKSRLGMKDIGKLNSGALAKCMLFQGGPGLGKTTLAWKLCREWQPGEPGAMFAEYSLVVFIPLRRKEVREAKELGDLFFAGNVDRETQQAIAKELQKNQGDKILLVLDGYDELPVAMQSESLVAQIVRGELLPNVNVLVTSRPSCCDTLYDKCSQREGFQHIEVLGFTQSKIDAYIEENVPPELRPKFQTYLSSHPKIRSMLYNPLQCALTVEVCKKMFEEGSTLPVTRTKLYEMNILMTVLREDPTIGGIRCLRQLPPTLHEKFVKLCHLAYNGIVRQQVIFEYVPEDVQELGLVVREPDIYSTVPTSETFNFFHLTIQEFCAGYHLSLLTEQEREEILKEHIKKRHFREVLIFLCGLCDNPSSIIDNVFQHAPEVEDQIYHNKRVDSQLFLHCAMESQNDDVIARLVKKLNSSIDLHREHLNPSDLSTVGFIMIKSKHPIKSLNLRGCYCGADGIKALFHQIQQSSVEHTSLSIEELNLSWNSIGDDGAKCFADGLQHCPNLQVLYLSSNSIGDAGAKCFADGLQHCPNLQTLNLSNNYIGDDGAKCLADGLQHCPNLQTLNLSNNSIGDDGAKCLADGLQHCPNLQTLNLYFNSIGVDGAKCLADSLQHCPNLQTLNLSHNSIGADGAKCLAVGLQHCPNLQTLYLSHNSIGADGAKCLADGLQHCPNLKTLDLNDNNIGDKGARYISEGLKHCPRLQELNLRCNNIGDEGAGYISEGFKHCPSLQTLDLCCNKIGDEGARYISEGFKHCPSLQTLDLDNNKIGDEGAGYFSEGLKHCPRLQKLVLSLNSIGADGAKCLADGLQHCPNLQTLNLAGNYIGDDGAKCLADGLQRCPNLQTLNLSISGIGDEGAEYISEGLKRWPRLQTLNVVGNEMTEEGKATLVKMEEEMNSKRQPHEEKLEIYMK